MGRTTRPTGRTTYEVSPSPADTISMTNTTTLQQIRTNHDPEVRAQDMRFYDTNVMMLLADPMVVPLSTIRELDRIAAKYNLTAGVI